jgi:hypothetical protein
MSPLSQLKAMSVLCLFTGTFGALVSQLMKVGALEFPKKHCSKNELLTDILGCKKKFNFASRHQ